MRKFREKIVTRYTIEECEKATEVETSIAWPLAELGHAYAISGRQHDAEAILRELEGRSKTKYVPAYQLAEVRVGMRHKDQALAMLEKACADRSMMLTLLTTDPEFESLHSTSRFKEVVRRIGLSQ